MTGREPGLEAEVPPPSWRPIFATTHWSVVLAAGNQAVSADGAKALEELCRAYWYPLYAYVRRRGYGHEDAQDFTQGFLMQLLERKSLGRADPSRGRFRSFLLAGMNYYLADARERASAQKRGGGQALLPLLDGPGIDARYRLEPANDSSPDKLFERRWALTLLDLVLARLEEEFGAAGKAGLFERMRGHLVAGAAEETCAEAAAALGISCDAFKKAVQRMRHRYGELFREEIARTVANEAEIEDEMRHLCAVVAG